MPVAIPALLDMRLPAFLFAIAILLLIAVGTTGCGEATSRTADEQAKDQRTITQLQNWNQRLLISGRQKDDQIRSVTRLVHKMIDDLVGVSNRQGLVRGVRVDQPIYLRAEFPQTERSIRAAEQQFVRYLSVIESNLQEGEQKIKRMREEPPSEAIEPESVELNELLDELQGEKDRRRALQTRIDSLSQLLDATRADKSSLVDQNDLLAENNEQLRRAYFVVGTSGSLEADGIIEDKLFRDATMREVDNEKFQVTSTNARSIPFEGDRATVLSAHQASPSLYTIEPGRLVIHDPTTFWALSRYLILETDG